MMKGDFRRSLIAVIVATLGSAAVMLGPCRASVVAMQADGSGPLGIRIRLRIERSVPASRALAQLKGEPEAIWRPYGNQLDWLEADAVEPTATGVSLDVTVERGRFAGDRGIEWAQTLGRTIVGPDTRGWRPIRLSFDAVASLLADGTTSHTSGSGIVLEPYRSRALGRVLAHEIGHVLTNAAGHDRTGLMRAGFSADQLAQVDRSSFRLACATVDRLNDRFHIVEGAPLIARPDTDVCIR